jgi:hypothetical protein
MKQIKYLLIVFILSGCASWGENLGEGVSVKFQSHADSIAYKLGYGLINGIRDSLTGIASQQKLSLLIDTLLHQAGIRSAKEVAGLLDTLAGETTNGKIRSLLENVRHGLDSIRDDVVGKRTGTMLARIIQNDILGTNTQLRLQHIINEGVLGPVTQERIGIIMSRIRDTLIGISTQSSIDSVVARSLARIESTGNEQQSFLKKNVTAILWTAGAVLAALLVLAAFLFIRKRKTEKMLGVVTKQIDTIPDKQHYDDLTKKISLRSKQAGVEKDLRIFLAKNIPPAH